MDCARRSITLALIARAAPRRAARTPEIARAQTRYCISNAAGRFWLARNPRWLIYLRAECTHRRNTGLSESSGFARALSTKSRGSLDPLNNCNPLHSSTLPGLHTRSGAAAGRVSLIHVLASRKLSVSISLARLAAM